MGILIGNLRLIQHVNRHGDASRWGELGTTLQNKFIRPSLVRRKVLYINEKNQITVIL